MATPAENLSTAIETAFEQTRAQQHSAAPAAPAAPEPERAAAPEATRTETGETQKPDEAKAQPPSVDGAELLSKEELKALEGKPIAEIERAFKGAYTRKTQELAAANEVLAALKADPHGTLERLAAELGYQPASAAATEEKPKPEAQAATAIQTQIDDIKRELETVMEPDLAARVGAAIEKAAARVVQQAIEPVRTAQQQQALETATRQTEAVLAEFTAKHPDWRKHEAAMVAAAQQLEPRGMADIDYLELIHYWATRDQSEAERMKALLKKQSEAASKAESSGSGVVPARVAKTAPTGGSFEDKLDASFEAALRGERWEKAQ